MSSRVYQVSEIVSDLQANLEGNPYFQNLLIEGEVSNLRIPYTGHWYFSLKDRNSALDCAFLSYQNRYCPYKIKNGDKVIVKGGINVYVPQGKVQFKVQSLKPSGQGDLYAKLEELKRRLNQEGLFNPAHKKPLPPYPMDIAVVTGNATAAREDIYRTFKERWPIARLTDYPAPVQGKDAAPKIIQALRKADEGGHELIILARGGGSIEDLWCFNDESLARFIYDMKTPVVTGVGHEIDTTLVDYVSDHRSVTPTGAVEDSTPDIHEVESTLNQYRIHMIQMMKADLSQAEMHFRRVSENPVFLHPQRLVQEKETRLSTNFQKLTRLIHGKSSLLRGSLQSSENRMESAVRKKLDDHKAEIQNQAEKLNSAEKAVLQTKKDALAKTASLLDAYSPLKVLARGYSIVSQNGKVISEAETVETGSLIDIRLHQGSLRAEVKEKTHGSKEEKDI
jgi:exodeoxyribonuclease VII large subunit